jgi:hypothetical protein
MPLAVPALITLFAWKPPPPRADQDAGPFNSLLQNQVAVPLAPLRHVGTWGPSGWRMAHGPVASSAAALPSGERSRPARGVYKTRQDSGHLAKGRRNQKKRRTRHSGGVSIYDTPMDNQCSTSSIQGEVESPNRLFFVGRGA